MACITLVVVETEIGKLVIKGILRKLTDGLNLKYKGETNVE